MLNVDKIQNVLDFAIICRVMNILMYTIRLSYKKIPLRIHITKRTHIHCKDVIKFYSTYMCPITTQRHRERHMSPSNRCQEDVVVTNKNAFGEGIHFIRIQPCTYRVGQGLCVSRVLAGRALNYALGKCARRNRHCVVSIAPRCCLGEECSCWRS
jgi:hypothetical protein